MSDVKIYTITSDDLSPPIKGEGFCIDMVRHSDYAALEERLNQMAAENAALREYRPQPSGAAMMEALDAFYEYHEDVPEQGMMAAFEILCCKRPQALATDAWQREQMARGVDKGACALDDVGQFNYANMLDDLAQQLRNGEAV